MFVLQFISEEENALNAMLFIEDDKLDVVLQRLANDANNKPGKGFMSNGGVPREPAMLPVDSVILRYS
jgi:hypothetical protein